MINNSCPEGEKYPTAEDLILTSNQFRVPAKFTPHPDEPELDFNPKKAEIRILTVRPKSSTTDGNPSNSLDFSCLGGNIDIENGLEDVHYIIRRFYEEGYDNPEGGRILRFEKEKCEDGDGGGIEDDDTTDDAVVETLDFGPGGTLIPFVVVSPYDISFEEQCYLVLILDPSVNWQFMANGRGVTTKAYYGSDNFGVSFAKKSIIKDKDNKDKIVVRFSDPETCFGTSEGCIVLLFGVARRRADATPPVPGYNSKQGFNFHIEFKWKARLHPDDSHLEPHKRRIIPEMRLPLIFDPDVPNSGGGSIP